MRATPAQTPPSPDPVDRAVGAPHRWVWVVVVTCLLAFSAGSAIGLFLDRDSDVGRGNVHTGSAATATPAAFPETI